MHDINQTWALVLAAGDGSRLHSMTTDANGVPIPKQFCSLQGGPSLLGMTLERAGRLVARDRIAVVVAARHRQWWESSLSGLDRSNVIVQPRNRGTGIGVLFAVLKLLERDPGAQIAFLPSDHFIRDERPLADALHLALNTVEACPSRVALLGVTPDRLDPELGYVVPDAGECGAATRVSRFVEKPDRREARALIEQGALWSSFIFVAEGLAVLRLFYERHPQIVLRMRRALRAGTAQVEALFEELPGIDFSRDVIEGAEADLALIRVPACGWNDLGTPERVGHCLDALPVRRPRRPATHRDVNHGIVDLAASRALLREAV
jgi:mannose-1-phosphate guanylyltransferase